MLCSRLNRIQYAYLYHGFTSSPPKSIQMRTSSRLNLVPSLVLELTMSGWKRQVHVRRSNSCVARDSTVTPSQKPLSSDLHGGLVPLHGFQPFQH